MIKAIITDIDGIIVGEKIGFNSPHPNNKVLHALRTIREKGIPICLCSGKPHYAIGEIIKRAKLHNPHITDGGAVTIDPIDNIIVEKHILDKKLAKEVLCTCRANNVYVEFY